MLGGSPVSNSTLFSLIYFHNKAWKMLIIFAVRWPRDTIRGNKTRGTWEIVCFSDKNRQVTSADLSCSSSPEWRMYHISSHPQPWREMGKNYRKAARCHGAAEPAPVTAYLQIFCYVGRTATLRQLLAVQSISKWYKGQARYRLKCELKFSMWGHLGLREQFMWRAEQQPNCSGWWMAGR